MPEPMEQRGPYPTALADLVTRLRYRPGWTFTLTNMVRDKASGGAVSAGGLTLVIYAAVYDSYHPTRHRPVLHYFAVPAATYNEASWTRWLLDQCLLVEQHETCEWFRLMSFGGDEVEVRPFAPNHGPGNNPYSIRELTTARDRATSFRGDLNPFDGQNPINPLDLTGGAR